MIKNAKHIMSLLGKSKISAKRQDDPARCLKRGSTLSANRLAGICAVAATASHQVPPNERTRTVSAGLRSAMTALLLAGAFALPDEVQAAPPLAETQADLNESADGSLEDAERELESVLVSIARQYADKPLFLDRLDNAQAAWELFVEAELEAVYPPTEFGDVFDSYGSMYPLCLAEKKQALIAARIRTLRSWLAGSQEGDVCVGSIKLQENLGAE